MDDAVGMAVGMDEALVRWVVENAAPGAVVDGVRGLRAGGSPWLLRLRRGDECRRVVLRAGDARDPSPLRTEAAALRLVEAYGVPAPRLVAADPDHDPPLLLTTVLPGSSAIPADPPAARLRALGAVAAGLHRIPVEEGATLPWRDRPIAIEDFAALRRARPADPLLAEAERRVAGHRPQNAAGLVHGDLWQGNTMWEGDTLAGLVDWDCAGVGPAGVDLGSLRCDAAVCFGPEAADEVRRGWEQAAGRADDLPYWDVVACLSTPPDMGWFAGSIAGQGRPDLSQAVLRQRRDAFLASALDRWGRG